MTPLPPETRARAPLGADDVGVSDPHRAAAGEIDDPDVPGRVEVARRAQDRIADAVATGPIGVLAAAASGSVTPAIMLGSSAALSAA